MSDSFRSMVDPEADETDAPLLANTVLSWLINERVVLASQTDCVLSEDGLGHAPGPEVGEVLEDGWEQYAESFSSGVNGLEILVGRHAYHAMEFSRDDPVHCPLCGAANEADDEWTAAIDEWCEGGPGLKTCHGCGRAAPILAWKAAPDWAFGYLGFTFWNWPDLREELVMEVSRRLGHRVVQIIGGV